MKLFKKISKRSSIKSINKGFLSNIGRLTQLMASGKRNEEEVRRWCIDVLRSGMGYSDDQIETEFKIMGQRVDIAIKIKGVVCLVIECKAATVKLNDACVLQASRYAVGLGAEWAAVTNGHCWQLYHVTPSTGIEPEIQQIFDVSILDEDGISEEDSDNLYLLTEQAMTSGETKEVFHQQNCLSFERILEALKSEDVMVAISKKVEESYKKNMGVTVDVKPEWISDIMQEMFEIFINGE